MRRSSTVDEIAAALPRLRRFARALAGANDGEDLAQATLERAIGRAHLYTPGTRIESWLFRIAQNLHINDRRSARRREDATDPADMAALAPAVEGAAEAHLLLGRVAAALDDLPAEQRAALVAVAIDGRSYAEAAVVLGWEPGTVASRVARARAALRLVIDDGGE